MKISTKPNRAFSLIELSIVILIIGVLIAAVGQGIDLLQDARLTAARMATQSSRVASIKNLIAWFEPTSLESFGGVEMNDGDAVTNWRDINPSNPIKLQTTTTSAPTYKRSCINNLPCLSFNGTSNYLDTTTLSSNSINSRQISVFAVVTPLNLSSTTNRSFIITNGSWVAGSFDLLITSASSTNRLGYEVQAATSYVYTTYVVKNNVTYIASVVDDGSASNLYLNGGSTLGTGNSIGSTAISNAYPFNIGYFNNVGARQEFFNGYFAELIIFDRALTTKERQSVEKYLSQKWKIKIS